MGPSNANAASTDHRSGRSAARGVSALVPASGQQPAAPSTAGPATTGSAAATAAAEGNTRICLLKRLFLRRPGDSGATDAVAYHTDAVACRCHPLRHVPIPLPINAAATGAAIGSVYFA